MLSVLWVSLSDETGGLTLIHFPNFFRRPLFREALWNTLVSGLLVVVFSGLISLPLAYMIARYEFRGKILLQTAATLPLVIPPFVGAVALQLILGRSGMVNLLLMRWFDTSIPFMEGLTGVVLVQTLHFFPFILLNTVVSLSNIDPSMEEMAQNMGCHGLRLFRRITLPLMLPGFIAGCVADVHSRYRRPRHPVDVELQKPPRAAGLPADHNRRDRRRRRLRDLRRSGGAFARDSCSRREST